MRYEDLRRLLGLDYLRACAQGEGGRAAMCMQGYGSPDTAYFFARSAAHYARMLRPSLRRVPRERKGDR